MTLENCIESLAHVRTLGELGRELPDITVNDQWEVLHRMRPNRIGKIRCIMGSSLRVDCDIHKDKCKLHIDIKAKFEWAQCELVKWVAHGLVVPTKEEHMNVAADVSGAWRALS